MVRDERPKDKEDERRGAKRREKGDRK